MEAIQHSHLMHTTGIIGGDDEMMDSDYDQAIPQDDDYDIELDGGEVYSNAGDEEMKFDTGEEAVAYDNDDLMLDEGEYQTTTTVHEEMIITEVQPINALFSSIEMSTATTTGNDHHITQSESHVDSSADLPDTQALTQLSQSSTQDINPDTFILSQHVPGIVVEVPNSPPVDNQVQAVKQDATEMAENTQQELQAGTQEDVIHSSHDIQPSQPYVEFRLPDSFIPGQAGTDDSVGPSAQSQSTLILDKIHPIIVQFESNTLALFNSEHYLNFSALDSSQSTYPEVPSVFLLQDVSFYTKGFDELFSALREMFGATIGDDAEITMEFEGLELFLHEDNLLSKSISLSDLMDLHLRLSKQDGVERPDPLYIVLSTQARFTKRYSELLTAAGEGKGLSQICTYSPDHEVPTVHDQSHSPQEHAHEQEENVENNEKPQAISPPAAFPQVEELNANPHKVEEKSPINQSQPNLPPSLTEKLQAVDDIPEVQEGVDDERQEYYDVEQAVPEGEIEEEEELLPAEDAEEKGYDGADAATEEGDNIQDQVRDVGLAENQTSPHPSVENLDPADTSVLEIFVEEVEEVVAEAQLPDEIYEPEKEQEQGQEQDFEEEELLDEVDQVQNDVEEVVEQQAVLNVALDVHESVEYDNPAQEEYASDEEALEENETAEGQPGNEKAVPVIVDTVYNPRSQDFNAEELLDYEEEEEQTSPISEIPNQTEESIEVANDGAYNVNDVGAEGESPVAALVAPRAGEITGHDDDSFSPATVVGVAEAGSNNDNGTSPHSETVQTQSPHDVNTEQNYIQAYQADEDEASADFDNAEAQDGEVEDLETYEIQYDTWEGGEGEDFPPEESYYTAIVDREGYVDPPYDEEQFPNTTAAQGEETAEGSLEEIFEENGEESVGFAEGEGFDEDGAYEEYPEDTAEEVTENETVQAARSPSGKRHREEESDAFDVQDIKRTRST